MFGLLFRPRSHPSPRSCELLGFFRGPRPLVTVICRSKQILKRSRAADMSGVKSQLTPPLHLNGIKGAGGVGQSLGRGGGTGGYSRSSTLFTALFHQSGANPL